MKDDTQITVKWNAQTCMYQAKVDYKGQTSNFSLPDAHNDWEANNQARHIMSQYKREVGDK